MITCGVDYHQYEHNYFGGMFVGADCQSATDFAAELRREGETRIFLKGEERRYSFTKNDNWFHGNPFIFKGFLFLQKKSKNFWKSAIKRLTLKKESDNMYKLSARASEKQLEKKLWKKLKKEWKNAWQRDKACGIIYKLSPRKRAARTVVRIKKIKNGIRKKWDFIWQTSKWKVISVNFFKVLKCKLIVT